MNSNNTPVSYPTAEEINPFHQISEQKSSNQPKETNPFLQDITAPESQPQYPSISHPTSTETNPFHQPSAARESTPQNDSITAQTTKATEIPQPSPTSQENEAQNHGEGPSSSSPPPLPTADESAEKWGTHVMGHPAVPTSHPGNKKAALWGAPSDQASQFHYPYVQYSPVEKSNNNGPIESILHVFNSWGNKAESLANNIWHNLKTGPSVSGAAWGKMNLTAKAITGGGYEPLYKQTFATYPNEKLKKTFACYLSTSTGPVAGTLYLSNVHVAFCSDRPLSFTAPSGQQSWSYYKVMVPLGNIGTINPVVMRENPSERYIQIVTIDGHDFWYMGFVNYDKASGHLTDSISAFVASGYAVPPVVANQKE